jgi:hypothetical protein
MSSVSSRPGVAGLFAQPVLRRLAVADVCARLPQGMVSLTLDGRPGRGRVLHLLQGGLAGRRAGRAYHALWASGPLLAAISIGSILGSLFLASHGYRLTRLLAGYAIGLGGSRGAARKRH